MSDEVDTLVIVCITMFEYNIVVLYHLLVVYVLFVVKVLIV